MTSLLAPLSSSSQQQLIIPSQDPTSLILLKCKLKDFQNKSGMDARKWSNYIFDRYIEPMNQFYESQARSLLKTIEDLKSREEEIRASFQNSTKACLAQLTPGKSTPEQVDAIKREIQTIKEKCTETVNHFHYESGTQKIVQKIEFFKAQIELIENFGRLLPSHIKLLDGSKPWNTPKFDVQMGNIAKLLFDIAAEYKKFLKIESSGFTQMGEITDQIINERVASPALGHVLFNCLNDDLYLPKLDVLSHLQHLVVSRIVEMNGAPQHPYCFFQLPINHGQGFQDTTHCAYQRDNKWIVLGPLDRNAGFLKDSQFSAMFYTASAEASTPFLNIPASVVQVSFSLRPAEQPNAAPNALAPAGAVLPDTCTATVGYALAPHGSRDFNFIELKAIVRLDDGVVTSLIIPDPSVLPPDFQGAFSLEEAKTFVESCISVSLEQFRSDRANDNKISSRNYSMILPNSHAERQLAYEEAIIELFDEALKNEDSLFIEWLVENDSEIQRSLELAPSPSISSAPQLILSSPSPSGSSSAGPVIEEFSQESTPSSNLDAFIEKKRERIRKLKERVVMDDEKSDFTESKKAIVDPELVKQKALEKQRKAQEFQQKQNAVQQKTKNKSSAQFTPPADPRPITEQLKSKDRAIVDKILSGNPVNHRQYKRVVEQIIKVKYGKAVSQRQNGSHLNFGLPNSGITLATPHNGHETNAFDQRSTVEELLDDNHQ